MNVASRSAVEDCVGEIKTRLDNKRGDSGGHGVSECRSDVSERPGMELGLGTQSNTHTFYDPQYALPAYAGCS